MSGVRPQSAQRATSVDERADALAQQRVFEILLVDRRRGAGHGASFAAHRTCSCTQLIAVPYGWLRTGLSRGGPWVDAGFERQAPHLGTLDALGTFRTSRARPADPCNDREGSRDGIADVGHARRYRLVPLRDLWPCHHDDGSRRPAPVPRLRGRELHARIAVQHHRTLQARRADRAHSRRRRRDRRRPRRARGAGPLPRLPRRRPACAPSPCRATRCASAAACRPSCASRTRPSRAATPSCSSRTTASACSTIAASTASSSTASGPSRRRSPTATRSSSAATGCASSIAPSRRVSRRRRAAGGVASAPLGATIAVLSQKGGTGKTTTVRTLTDIFRRAGLSVLAVDLDPQGNLSDYFDVDPEVSPTIGDVLAGRAKAKHADLRRGHAGEPLARRGRAHARGQDGSRAHAEARAEGVARRLRPHPAGLPAVARVC